MEKWTNINQELKSIKSQHALDLRNYQKTIAVLKTELAKNRTVIKNLKYKDQQQKEKQGKLSCENTELKILKEQQERILRTYRERDQNVTQPGMAGY